MAFKMKGPMFFGSALKNYNSMQDYSTKAVKFGEDDNTAMMKKDKTKTPYSHRIPEPFKGNYGQAHHNMDFDSDTSKDKKEHYKRNKH